MTPRHARRGRDPRGFTLVEVLVAMLVMAIMAVMAWQGVDGIVRTRDASQARLEQTLRLNTVVAQWDQDLASIQENAAVPSALKFDGATLRLVRRTPDGLQVVAWTLQPDRDAGGTGRWVRWAGPAVTTAGDLQQSWLTSLQLQGGEAGALTTLTGISGWQVYYYQTNGWANAQSSGNTSVQTGPVPGTPPGIVAPPASGREELPSGVRMVLSFAPGSGFDGDLTRDVLLRP